MGFFSWKTQDTNRSISNSFSKRGAFTVFMVNPITKESYKEDDYEGYGVFGGKDYYELLAEMNGAKTKNNKLREAGIDMAYPANPKKPKKKLVYPVLVEKLENANKFDGSEEAPSCPYQGYFYNDNSCQLDLVDYINNLED